VRRGRHVTVEPAEEQLGRGSSHRCRVLGDDRDPGIEEVRQQNVVEADQGDLVMQAESPQRAAGADRQQVLCREDGGRRRLPPEQFDRRCVGLLDARRTLVP